MLLKNYDFILLIIWVCCVTHKNVLQSLKGTSVFS